MALAAILVELHPRALSIVVIIFGMHVDDRQAREGLAHEADVRPGTQTDDGIDLDRIDQCPHLLSLYRDPKIEGHVDHNQVLVSPSGWRLRHEGSQ